MQYIIKDVYSCTQFLHANNLPAPSTVTANVEINKILTEIKKRIREIDSSERLTVGLSEERYHLNMYRCDLEDELIKRKRKALKDYNTKALSNWQYGGSWWPKKPCSKAGHIIKGVVL